MRVLLHDSLAVLWDVGRNRCPRRGELPVVPDASNGINRRALLVPDRGNGSTGLLRGVTSDSKSGSLIWQPLSRKRPKMRSSPQQQRRGLDRQATLHTIYEEKDSKYGGYSGEHPTKFLWKTIEKNIKFDSFLYAFWERGDDELLHVQRRMHPEAPESSRKAERLRIKPGDSNIKVIHWFKMNLQQYVKTFFT